MTSKALRSFREAAGKAERLLTVATDRRLRPLTYLDIEPALHASLAAAVSGWEAYVENIVLETIDAIAQGADAQRRAILSILKAEARIATEKFNTPNAENSRGLILRFTGYDPFSAMRSNRSGLAAADTQVRLNEILKVRHSFAHGFQVPAYSWTTRYKTANRLTKKAIKGCMIILKDISSNIDGGLSSYLQSNFNARFD